MFAKLCTLALALPLVSALTFGSTSGWTAGGVVTITWTSSATDPTSFSIELSNPSYHDTFAIATNVVTANGQVTIQLPEVEPGADYGLQAVAIENINQVYAQTPGTFSIGAAGSATATSASMPAITVSSGSTATTTGTSSAASSTPSTSKSSGAASFKLAGVVPAAALVLSAVAGAAIVV